MDLCGHLHITATPPPMERAPGIQGLGGHQNQSGHCGGEKNLLPQLEIETQFPSCAACSQFAVLTNITESFSHNFSGS
jgi:hypothetical protein